MNKDKKWMLITYYCPTHGNQGKVEPIEIDRADIGKSIFKELKSQEK